MFLCGEETEDQFPDSEPWLVCGLFSIKLMVQRVESRLKAVTGLV